MCTVTTGIVVLLVEDTWDEYYEVKYSGVFSSYAAAQEAYNKHFTGRSYAIRSIVIDQVISPYNGEVMEN